MTDGKRVKGDFLDVTRSQPALRAVKVACRVSSYRMHVGFCQMLEWESGFRISIRLSKIQNEDCFAMRMTRCEPVSSKPKTKNKATV